MFVTLSKMHFGDAQIRPIIFLIGEAASRLLLCVLVVVVVVGCSYMY